MPNPGCPWPCADATGRPRGPDGPCSLRILGFTEGEIEFGNPPPHTHTAWHRSDSFYAGQIFVNHDYSVKVPPAHSPALLAALIAVDMYTGPTRAHVHDGMVGERGRQEAEQIQATGAESGWCPEQAGQQARGLRCHGGGPPCRTSRFRQLSSACPASRRRRLWRRRPPASSCAPLTLEIPAVRAARVERTRCKCMDGCGWVCVFR